MSDREAQIEYYKQTVLIYSTGAFVSMGAVTAAVASMTKETQAETGLFIGTGLALFVVCLIRWTMDSRRFRKLVKLTK